MKKLYFLCLTLLITSVSFGQILITEIADPNGNADARFIELHNIGATDVDFTEGNGWQIDKYLNGNPGVNTTLDLTGTITAGGFYIIAYNNTDGTFQSVYGFAPDQLDAINNGVAGSNGDDDLSLVDGNDAMVDFFGYYDFDLDINEDNSGTCAEYEDGRAERLTSVTGPNTAFDESEWNVWADSDVTGCTSHQNAPRTAPGDFDPGAWGTPTCALSLSNQNALCDDFTPGTDTYSASVNFTGGGTATYTVMADSGSLDLSMGNPTTDATGTITVTGLTEGTDLIITVQDGGVCDLSSTITSPVCEPSNSLPLYEGFDYTVAQNLNDQANWSGINGGDDILIAGPGGLTYPNLAGSDQSGNHVTFDGSGMESKIDFTPANSGLVYSSFIFNVSDISAISDLTDGGYFAALSASDSGYDLRVWARPNPDAAGSTFDIAITTLSSAPTFSTGTYSTGTSIFIVMSYDLATGNIQGWINPDSASFGGTEPAADFTETDAGPTPVLDRFVLRQDTTGETPSILFDELRIGTTWADVTPTTLSTQDFTADSFKVYPNPTSLGFVNIVSANNETISVAVYDILGKEVITETLNNNRLNVSALNSGVYIMKVTQNNASVTKKLIIK